MNLQYSVKIISYFATYNYEFCFFLSCNVLEKQQKEDFLKEHDLFFPGEF